MYATGYTIHPLQSSRQTPLRHVGRWAMVMVAVIAVSVGLSKVALGDSRPVDATVVVQPGDTLWSIAAEHYPSADIRARVEAIERANGLHSPVIQIGETLRLPS